VGFGSGCVEIVLGPEKLHPPEVDCRNSGFSVRFELREWVCGNGSWFLVRCVLPPA